MQLPCLHPFLRPAESVGVCHEPHDFALSHPVLQEGDVLHPGGIFTQASGPEPFSVVREPAFARHKPIPHLDPIALSSAGRGRSHRGHDPDDPALTRTIERRSGLPLVRKSSVVVAEELAARLQAAPDSL